MPARILIADDNPQGAELLEAYLDELGAEVKTAGDGEANSNWSVSGSRPLLLDIMMPRMSGFEVCKRLRSNEETKKLGILMVTGPDQPVDIERAVEAGTDDFLTKPINKNELLRRVKALLKSKKADSPLDDMLNYVELVQHG